jgi:hypothetical protein
MKHFLTLAVLPITILSSCSNSFINHTMQSEKIGACSNEITPLKMTGNINGERYEFTDCLDEGFDGKNYTIERHGDSLLLKLPEPVTTKTALYKLIVDVDAKPAYHYITLRGQTIQIVPYDKF